MPRSHQPPLLAVNSARRRDKTPPSRPCCRSQSNFESPRRRRGRRGLHAARTSRLAHRHESWPKAFQNFYNTRRPLRSHPPNFPRHRHALPARLDAEVRSKIEGKSRVQPEDRRPTRGIAAQFRRRPNGAPPHSQSTANSAWVFHPRGARPVRLNSCFIGETAPLESAPIRTSNTHLNHALNLPSWESVSSSPRAENARGPSMPPPPMASKIISGV